MKLYKYRTISNNTLAIFKTNSLYLSPVSDLNDLYDALVKYNSKRLSGMNYDSKKYENFIKNMRVCALSEVDDSILMWGHYSNSFKGLVIEIDISKEKVHKINYILEDKLLEETEKLLKDIKKSKIKEKYLSYKTKSWEYENEYRIINCRGKKK